MLNYNKKGFILTAGITIILALFVLIVIGGMMVFVSMNKFALIGGGLIALTLIFGLKGNFSRQKGIFMFAIIAVGLFFILGGNMLQIQFGPSPSQIFIDKDLGMISISEQSALTEQAYFKTTNAIVGDTIQICEAMPLASSAYSWTKVEVKPSLNGNTYSTLDFTNYVISNAGKSYCLNFKANSPGKYTLNSYFEYCYNNNPSNCDTLTTTGANSLTVTEASEPACTKKAYTDPWKVKSNIANGQVLYQAYYTVESGCVYKYHENVMTQCNDNYVIEGSNLRQTENDGWSCVAIYVEPDPDPIPDPELDPIPEIDPECNVDLIVECGDGTSITSKLCVGGFYFDTEAECSSLEGEDCLENKIAKCSDGSEIVIANCVDGKYESTGNNCYAPNFMQQYGYYVVGVVFVLIVIILIFSGKRKKKR